jgi:DNA-binding response OmpR family regulator
VGRRILFVEDDRSLVILYTRVFSRLGYDLRVVGDAEEALEWIRREPPDLMVVDVKLRGEMSGLELVDKALLLHRFPTIINTAYVCYRDNFLSWSADAYVLKSSDTTELVDTVGRLLEAEEARRGAEAAI